MPPRPLALHEFRGNFVISHEMSGLGPFSIGLNFYWGVGKDVNLGLGIQPPIGLSHLTLAKYYKSNERSSWCAFTSINGIFLTFDESPNFDFGASLIIRDGRAYHSFSSGIWVFYDDYLPESISKFYFSDSMPAVQFRPKPRPFWAYEFQYDRTILSIKNYMGFANKVIGWERKQIDQNPEITIRNSDISFFDNDRFGYSIRLNDRTRISITSVTSGDLILPFFPTLGLIRLPYSDSLEICWVHVYQPNGKIVRREKNYNNDIYELNLDKIKRDYIQKKDIVIAPVPERSREILKRIHWYKHDWSIAIGTTVKDSKD